MEAAALLATSNSTASAPLELELAAISVCAFVGATVSAMTGFGGALIYLAFAAVASRLVALSFPRVIMFGIFRSVLTNPVTVYLGGWRHCNLPLMRTMLPGIVLGAPLGQLLLTTSSSDALRRVVGLICLVVVTERLSRVRHAAPVEGTVPLQLVDDFDADAPAPRAAVRRIAATASGLASGFLGASIGTSGIPVMLFVSYFPQHKTTTRTMVSLVGIPPQTFATASFMLRGVLVPTRDWPCLLSVLGVSAAGVFVGNRLHALIDSAVALNLLLLVISCAAIELVSASWAVRVVCALLLAAVVWSPWRRCRRGRRGRKRPTATGGADGGRPGGAESRGAADEVVDVKRDELNVGGKTADDPSEAVHVAI